MFTHRHIVQVCLARKDIFPVNQGIVQKIVQLILSEKNLNITRTFDLNISLDIIARKIFFAIIPSFFFFKWFLCMS